MAKKKDKIALGDQSAGFASNPFAALLGHPDLPAPQPEPPQPAASPTAIDLSKAKLHFNIERKGRGGKTVTLVGGLELDDAQLSSVAAALKKSLGVGVSIEEGQLVVQGDQRPRMAAALAAFGYKEKK